MTAEQTIVYFHTKGSLRISAAALFTLKTNHCAHLGLGTGLVRQGSLAFAS